MVFDENFFDEIDHFHPNFDESVPNRLFDVLVKLFFFEQGAHLPVNGEGAKLCVIQESSDLLVVAGLLVLL